MRLGGLVTGFDTENLINQLMQIERQPIQRMQQDIQEIEGEKDQWRDVNKLLAGIDDELGGLQNKGTFDSMQGTSTHENIGVSVENHADENDYHVEVNEVATAHRIASSDPVEEDFETFLDTEDPETHQLEIDVNDDTTTIDVEPEYELQDVVEEINAADVPVRASILGENYLHLESDEVGADNEMEIDNSDQEVLDWLRLEEEERYESEATDADIILDGMIEMEQGSNQIEIADGVEVDISAVTAAELEDNGVVASSISVSRDMETPMANVEAFEERFNEAMGTLDEKTDVTVIDDDAAGEEEIEAGALQGDATINNIITNIRRSVTNPVNVAGEGIELEIDGEMQEVDELVPAHFGIEVGGDMVEGGSYVGTSNELSIDYDVLRDRLEENPEAVYQLFGGDDGIAARMDEYLDGVIYSEGDEPSAGQTHDRGHSIIENRLITKMGEIDRMEDRIESRERRLDQREERLWQEFTRMEEAIAEMQAEQQGMTQALFGSMQGMMM